MFDRSVDVENNAEYKTSLNNIGLGIYQCELSKKYFELVNSQQAEGAVDKSDVNCCLARWEDAIEADPSGSFATECEETALLREYAKKMVELFFNR